MSKSKIININMGRKIEDLLNTYWKFTTEEKIEEKAEEKILKLVKKDDK